MPRFAEVIHHEWIAAAVDTVSAQFADLDHHIAQDVHPKLRLQVLQRGADAVRYRQEVRLLGLRQVDVFERRFGRDGGFVDQAVEGFNRGGSLQFSFLPQPRDGRAGTQVEIVVRLPLPPLVGPLLRPLLEAQVRREVAAAAREDVVDIEQRGYPRAHLKAA